MWIRKDLKYTRNENFDDSLNPIISIKIGYPNMKKFNLIAYYRQFKPLHNHQKRNNKAEQLQFKNITQKSQSSIKMMKKQ